MILSEAIDRIRPTIVQVGFIAVELLGDLQRRVRAPFINIPLGTGFLVNGDGYVITARHVMESGRRLTQQVEARQKRTQVGLAHPNTENFRGNFTVVDFDIVDEDAIHDLALLKLKQNPFKGEVRSGFAIGGREMQLLFDTAILNPRRPKEGAAVGISGYPLEQPVLVSNGGWIAASWSFDITEVPMPGMPQRFSRPHVSDSFLADVEVNPGNSGGPVYLVEDATVIGVCVASKPSPVRDDQGDSVGIDGRKLYYSSGLTVVVPARYVIELLKKHGANWSESRK